MSGKILIIDDETDFCLIMKSYFRKRNYEVFLAFTLHNGLSTLEEVKPDILFLDNNLPDGQGWDHVHEIVEKNPHIRVYLVSAYHNRSNLTEPVENITIWEKPISLRELDAVFQ
jgi:DNA-binding response OmpR family regulator